VKARIVNGRIIVDEPTDLPEGTEWEVMLYDREGDGLTDEDRAALHRSLLRGIAEADDGQLVDADDALADLDSPM
jgi:hypothetical protein